MGLIHFGKVVKVHGLSGGIKLFPFSRQFDNLARLKRVFILTEPEGEPVEFRITSSSIQKTSAVVRLEGVDSLNVASALEGCAVMVDSSDLMETEEGEYYWFQLIGLEVYTDAGEYVGRVENLIDRPPQSLLTVKRGGREFLIPMVDAIIKEVNLADSKIVVIPIAGLLD
ncbi:MAG: ribosome maturation factor RimM [Deltaproteobacteria bacterium]